MPWNATVCTRATIRPEPPAPSATMLNGAASNVQEQFKNIQAGGVLRAPRLALTMLGIQWVSARFRLLRNVESKARFFLQRTVQHGLRRPPFPPRCCRESRSRSRAAGAAQRLRRSPVDIRTSRVVAPIHGDNRPHPGVAVGAGAADPGMDVARYQGPVDFSRVYGGSVSTSVYMKATEGKDYLDPNFRENWRKSRACGHGAWRLSFS